jgi:hypothetical protein
MRTRPSILAFILVLVSAVTAMGQLTVDATGPIRNRTREATRSSGGGVGRRLSLQVAIRTPISATDANGRTLVEFTLTNSGTKAITLPVSPHPGDLEPSDPTAAYSVLTLGLRVSLSQKPGVILPGGADLYGSASDPPTLVNLAPGNSMRVIARVALPNSVSGPIIATASLDSDTLKRVNGELLLDSREVGFATSNEYTLDSLLREHD